MINLAGSNTTKTQSMSDRQRLRRLGTLHYPLAGLQALTTALLAVILMESSPTESTWQATASWTLISSMAALSVLTFVAGRRLIGRQEYSFCLTVAALNCFYFPFGTILGMLTIITLKRAAVRALFPPSRPYHPNVDTWENRRLH